MDFDSYIRGLLNEVEGLFGTKPQSAPNRVSQNPINYPGGYTAPIHGSWASSGGFTYTPSGSHPHGHMGVDMRCQAGTPVYPLTSGVVTNVGTDPGRQCSQCPTCRWYQDLLRSSVCGQGAKGRSCYPQYYFRASRKYR